MAIRQTTTMVTGPSGAGKSYMAVQMVVDEFLVNEVGQLITNLPLDIEGIVKYCGRKFQRVHRLKTLAEAQDLLRKRIEIIPRETCQSWSREESHFSDFLGESDIAGAFIIIDEIHNFAGIRHATATIAKWQEFCGELRHRRASVMLLTQDEHKLSGDILREGGVLTILNSADEEVIAGVRVGDWLDLAAYFTRVRGGGFARKIKRREGGRWVESRSYITWYRSEIFACYDSYNAPVKHGINTTETGAVSKELREKEIWQRLGLFAMLGHFWGRNWFPLSKWGSFLFLAFFFSLGPGAPMVVKSYQSFWARIAAKQQAGLSAAQSTRGRLKTEAAKDPVAQQAQAEYLVHLNNALQSELTASQGMLSMAQAKLAWMAAIAIVSPDSVTFRNGFTYHEGDTIDDGGPYDGQRIVKVDFKRRLAQLGSGVVLRLAGTGGGKDCPCNQTAPVSASVPGGGKTPTPARTPQPGGKRPDALTGSSPPVGLRPIPEPGNQRVNSGSGIARRQTGVPVSSRPTPIGRFGGRGSTPGGASVSGGEGLLPRRSATRGQGGPLSPRQSADSDGSN